MPRLVLKMPKMALKVYEIDPDRHYLVTSGKIASVRATSTWIDVVDFVALTNVVVVGSRVVVNLKQNAIGNNQIVFFLRFDRLFSPFIITKK